MISKRLQYIVDMVTHFETIADIGCDHGYVCVELIKNNKVKKAIASDISYPSLKKTIDFVKVNKIAGMGGVLISEILKKNYNLKFKEKNPLWILQPVQQAKNLRYYLYENKFEIVDEDIIFDMGKYYNIIIAKKVNEISNAYLTIENSKDVYMEYGILNIVRKNILVREILEERIKNSKKLFDDLKQKQVKISDLNILLQKIKEMEDVYETLWFES